MAHVNLFSDVKVRIHTVISANYNSNTRDWSYFYYFKINLDV